VTSLKLDIRPDKEGSLKCTSKRSTGIDHQPPSDLPVYIGLKGILSSFDLLGSGLFVQVASGTPCATCLRGVYSLPYSVLQTSSFLLDKMA